MTNEDLITEARRFSARFSLSTHRDFINRLAGALEHTTARLREAEAVIEATRKHIELSLGTSAQLSTAHYILATYEPTTESEETR